MKKLIYVLFALPWILVSCSQEADHVVEESVEVNFSTAIPGQISTRATDLSVNKLVCAVFEKGEEVKALRKTIENITDPTMISYTPRLVKGRTYTVVFWAMKDENYNVSDLTAIVRSSNGSLNEADYDAFTAATSITVQDAVTVPVTLTRPLAQLNLGVTELDWNTVTTMFGQTPTTTILSYYEKASFNSVTGESLTGYTTQTRTVEATGDELMVAGNTYKSLGSFFVLLPESEEQTLDIKFTILDDDGQSIRKDVLIPQIPVQRNYKTNVVGGLLTGTVNYQVTISDGFSNTEHNKVL